PILELGRVASLRYVRSPRIRTIPRDMRAPLVKGPIVGGTSVSSLDFSSSCACLPANLCRKAAVMVREMRPCQKTWEIAKLAKSRMERKRRVFELACKLKCGDMGTWGCSHAVQASLQ